MQLPRAMEPNIGEKKTRHGTKKQAATAAGLLVGIKIFRAHIATTQRLASTTGADPEPRLKRRQQTSDRRASGSAVEPLARTLIATGN